MNIAMTEGRPAASQSLKDKVSLVTGSTSGIGLGIARTLASVGSAVVLNEFGKPEEIAATQGIDQGLRRRGPPLRADQLRGVHRRRERGGEDPGVLPVQLA